MAYVIQALAKPDKAPQDDEPSSRVALVDDAMPVPVDDSRNGLGLFVLFTVAVLVVTGAVGFLALLTSWWVLGVVFGLHVLVTVIVGTAVFTVLGTEKPSLASDDRFQLKAATRPDVPIQSRVGPGHASRIAA